MSDKNPPSLPVLREDLKNAQAAFDKHPSHYSATSLQLAQNALERRYEANRKALVVVEGSEKSHDLSDVEVCGYALKEILTSIKRIEADDQIIGTLMHCHNVARQALTAIGKVVDG